MSRASSRPPAGSPSVSARLAAWLPDAGVRFRVLLAATLTVIVSLAAGTLLVLNHRAVSQMRETQVSQQFEIMAASVRSQVSLHVVSTDVVLDTLAVSFPADTADEAAATALARVLDNLLEASPAVVAVYVARGDGGYALARRITAQGRSAAAGLGAGEAVFEIQVAIASGDRRLEHLAYLDAGFAVLGRTPPRAVAYDARTRPWYRRAARERRAVVTPPYRFQDYGATGVTLSRRGHGAAEAVFAIDLTFPELSRTLREQLLFPEERVALFEPGGSLIAESGGLFEGIDLATPGPPGEAEANPDLARARAVYAAYRSDPSRRATTLRAGGEEVMVDLAPIRIGEQDLVIASMLPAETFNAPILRWVRWSLAAQGALILLACLAALRASRWMADPILSLATEVERIVAFRFSGAGRPASRIWEIRRLAGAVDTLELTLRAFSTYLPTHFVRGIVERKTLPTLGGSKQQVVVMFSDIAGFTAMAEALPPDQLMLQTSRYLTEISDAVIASGGTVDKFIGDSVMAFWTGEPDEAAMADTACEAVLQAAERVARLNEAFAREGLPVMPTRFGLHAGEAMVGNVGTPERMNYTVLGHTVNVASRIEGLNKAYGTSILVTEAVARCAAKVELRLVDRVMVRGASEATAVFTLVGRHRDG